MSALSGWCPPHGHTEAQHRVCGMRQNEPDERVRLGPCGCEEYGGHEKPVVERDSASNTVESGTRRGPDRANESDPLATVSTKPKGA